MQSRLQAGQTTAAASKALSHCPLKMLEKSAAPQHDLENAFVPPQACQPLVLKSADGDEFEFPGVRPLVKGSVSVEAALVPPHALTSAPLSAAQLANQV